MPLDTFNFTTGPATLPDVGILSYEGCLFSPLFATNVSGTAVKDNAQRTVKFMEYTIIADGYVTLPVGNTSISPTMARLRELLTRQGGALVYQGRGMDLVVNGGSTLMDVAWGPVPEMLEFQPLGGGLSAKIKWQVKVRIPEIRSDRAFKVTGIGSIPLLQFNYESAVNYGEDGYTSMTERGTMEIPLTRMPSQRTRTLTETVDDVRSILDDRIFNRINLVIFRVTHREFNVSRDKRTMEWSYSVEEKPYMDLPPNCNVARGSFNVRPAKAGMGLCLWLCTLRASYTVRLDRPRGWAWNNFLSLLRLRMAQSYNASLGQGVQLPPGFSGVRTIPRGLHPAVEQQLRRARYAWLIDFSFDEGLYLDSKTTSFSATWRLVTKFDAILEASGLWKKVDETGNVIVNRTTTSSGTPIAVQNRWAVSMSDILGSKSWGPNKDALDPTKDLIVDFGSD